MKQRTLVYVTSLYGLGILFASYYPISIFFWFFSAIGLLVLWFLGSNSKRFWGWLLLMIFFCLGAAFYGFKNERQQELLAKLPIDQEIKIEGKVLAGPFSYPNRTVYEIGLQNNTKVHLKIRGAGQGVNLKLGDEIIVKGFLTRPKDARNPGEFDYRSFLWRQGILAELSATPQGVELIREARGSSWRKFLNEAKINFTAILADNMSPRAEGISRALIFGDKTALEQDLKELFLVLGVMHLFAVSGLHVGFLLLLAYILRHIFNFAPKGDFIFTVLLLIMYAALTNFTPSVLRASLMALVILLGGSLRRERDFYTSLAAAGLILLLYNPFNLFQSGFQMSFLAAGGILYFRPLIGKLLPETFRLRELVMIPVTAQIAVLPVTAYYFNLISLVGLVINILLVPIAGLIVIGGLIAFLVSFFSSGLASIFLLSLGVLIDLLVQIMQPIAFFSWSAMTVATPSVGLIIFYYLILAGIREIIMREDWLDQIKEHRNVIIIFILLIFALGLGWKQFVPRPLEIVFLDVGQGDAIFMRTPTGKTILLDGGGTPGWQESSFRVGKEVVVPYLERQGVKKVDLIINSHPHEDHLQGLEDVLLELGANMILIPPQNLFSQDYDSLIELATIKKILLEEVVAGDKIYLEEGITLEVLNPPGYNTSFSTSAYNNHSLLIRVSYGDATFLLTGDLEIEALQYLDRMNLVGEATVFKAPHHGSRTGYYEPYFDKLDSLAVVLSVGRNFYGHPALELIDYWEKRGVAVYRTDQHGAIMIFTDGKKLKIRPFITEVN